MKKLTKGQRFALAREARRLAMECVEGTAPQLEVRHKFINGKPGCAVGHVQHRAGIPETSLSLIALHEAILLFGENDRAAAKDRHAAVVFPLLALADAIEASVASARKRPQRQSMVVP